MWWFAVLTMAPPAWASCSNIPGDAPRLPAPKAPFEHEARIEGMVARWRVEETTWVVQLEAKTRGWVVLGTNQVNDIVGANLFFGWQTDGVGGAAHHIVNAPGRHGPVARSEVALLGSHQTAEGTTVRLRVPAPTLDKAHGAWLVLAWSQAPELDHHSAVRRHVHVQME
ncbi:MAG: hypothetical protein AAGA48_05975 [Myxococcota bacterium]